MAYSTAVAADRVQVPGWPDEKRQAPLLTVEGLQVAFDQYTGGLQKSKITAIQDMDLEVYPGEVLAVVGASGSGKSLLAHAILGILPPNAVTGGAIYYAGRPLDARQQARLRGREIALIPQSVNFLNPLLRVGDQLLPPGRPPAAEQRERAAAALREVLQRYQLPPDIGRYYPFQLSGGLARRVLVGTAVLSEARLIVADEPTPGLHSSVVQETLRHLRQLADAGRAVLLITHDIEAALAVADRLAVFYAGTVLEIAPVDDFDGSGEALRHPYSKALWRALPQNDFAAPWEGGAALLPEEAAGCWLEKRCPISSPRCVAQKPVMRPLRGGKVRCHHAT
ncbi:ATP-binding cassette domain-containing protein [Desulfurispora thermophila]|uniref:ATP-binding cassette domain-containing protein n=1 Tax=Desulfurispora thermophila TaxID=265470 RepID=UPI00036CAFD3|nr:ABC transporter ATP-binding protein [Desulfurispora thermophila]